MYADDLDQVMDSKCMQRGKGGRTWARSEPGRRPTPYKVNGLLQRWQRSQPSGNRKRFGRCGGPNRRLKLAHIHGWGTLILTWGISRDLGIRQVVHSLDF
jgi:hypothetical protein